MPGFDVASARKAGYSEDDILKHLTETRKFDVNGAVKAGYSKSDIIQHLSGAAPAAAGSTPAVSSTIRDDDGNVISEAAGAIPQGMRNVVGAAGDALGQVAQGVWNQVNPATIVQGLGQAVMHPVDTAAGLWNAQGDLVLKAKQAFDAGDYVTAGRHALESLLPIIGPGMSAIGDKAGQPGKLPEAIGEAIGFGLMNTAIPEKIATTASRSFNIPGIKNGNAVKADALEYMRSKGADVGVGPATGNAVLGRAQKLVDSTFLGSRSAKAAEENNVRVFQNTAKELADQVHPAPVVAEQAGRSLQNSARTVKDAAEAELHTLGDKLASRIHPDTVSGEQAAAAVRDRLSGNLNTAEAAILDKGGDIAARIHGRAVAPEQAGSTFRGGLEGKVANLQSVADDRYAPFHEATQNPAYAREVPVGRGADGKPIVESVNMPVDVRQIKSSLKPLFDHWMRWIEPAQRNASRGFQAVKSIIEQPDFISADIAEEGLSGLKSLAREGPYAAEGGEGFSQAMRTRNQGIGAMATKMLQDAVDAAAERAGPRVKQALQEGRKATAMKFDVADLVKQLRDEPVQAFGQLTYSDDSGIAFLRKAAKEAPEQIPVVARALVDQLREEAQSGNWKAAERAWQKIGNETKKVLFTDPTTVSELDDYFRQGRELTEAHPLRELRGEPVQAFAQLTYANDSGVEYLRKVAKEAPEQLPAVGRAYVDSLREEARAGNWKAAQRKWDQLGAETKKILFREPEVAAGLDDFFAKGRDLHENNLLRELHDEPVRAFQQLTYRNDSGIDLLKRAQKEAPADIPKIGRAYLEGLFEDATRDGGWTKAKGIWERWNDLGTSTKEILFPQPGVRAQLNKFFLTAKEVAENPNPSGTGYTSVMIGEAGLLLKSPGLGAAVSLGAGAIAKLLHSPKGLRLLTDGLKTPAASPKGAWTATVLATMANDAANRGKGNR
jgi:hypothetical protein